MKSPVAVSDDNAKAIPAPLAGKWCLTGGTTTRLEINRDGSGSIEGSMWGREPVEWSIAGGRLLVAAERGVGSASYAIGDGNELVLSRVQGLFILVAGTYTPADVEDAVGSIENVLW